MKKVSPHRYVGNEGVIRLQHVVNQMGYLWRPTPNDDYGIDGEIEVVEDNAATARILKVQVRSGQSYFRNEQNRTFEFHADTSDLEYWLNANLPVLLVLYHPGLDRLYWTDVQRYARENPSALITRRIVFDKVENLLTVDRMPQIREVVFKTLGEGRHSLSRNRKERIHSNLLPLLEIPLVIYSLPTKARDKREVRDRLQEASKPPFVLKEGRLWTFSYLHSEGCSLRLVCEREQVSETPVSSWKRDEPYRRWLVELFNECLRKRCVSLGLIYDFKHGRYYCPPRDGKEWWFAYQSFAQRARRRPAYPSLRKDGTVRFWVHYSARLRFIELVNEWFLKVEPGYVFTEDGYNFLAADDVGRLATSRKSGERNLAVLRHLIFWREFLSNGEPVIGVFPGAQRLTVAKEFSYGLCEFGLAGDGPETHPAFPEEDEFDLEELQREIDQSEGY